MIQIHNWWLPDNEIHLKEKIEEQSVINRGFDYQTQQRDYAILLNKKFVRRNRFAVEIGGHVGLWAVDICKNFSRVEIFEPVEEFRKCLHKNLKDRNIDNYKIQPFALGSKEHQTHIKIDPTSTGDTHINENSKTVIDVKKLDNFNYDNVDFIKIDTEGYEYHVLKGAIKTLKKHKPMIVVEIKEKHLRRFNTSPEQIHEYLTSLDYILDNVVNSEYIYVHKSIEMRTYFE